MRDAERVIDAGRAAGQHVDELLGLRAGAENIAATATAAAINFEFMKLILRLILAGKLDGQAAPGQRQSDKLKQMRPDIRLQGPLPRLPKLD